MENLYHYTDLLHKLSVISIDDILKNVIMNISLCSDGDGGGR
jgi:hypothetical protein